MPDTLPASIPASPQRFTPGQPIPAEADPMELFAHWLAEANASEVNDPNAMTLATVADGRPSARVVLLKGIEPRGLVFYSNLESRKGVELAGNPHAALLFHWKSLRRQIRVEGVVEAVTDAEADAYFATRARISRLGAWASEQSRPLPDRATLERRVQEMEQRFPPSSASDDVIPRPANWSGYRVLPAYFEFWQDMPYRLHDRRTYTRDGAAWLPGALYP